MWRRTRRAGTASEKTPKPPQTPSFVDIWLLILAFPLHQALAKLVGTQGRAVGVDTDAAMLQKAKEQAQQANIAGDCVSFVQADVRQLPFPDAHFHAVRAERLLQVMLVSL